MWSPNCVQTYRLQEAGSVAQDDLPTIEDLRGKPFAVLDQNFEASNCCPLQRGPVSY